eukprot:TRINITY_DN33711_c0_g1_i2.p1 TRINITY_DN33711_c0_g1~~TRINITY_DN33711_c0_g1_i2.p1  ORF type:complete len:329 (-),score=58.70 TRINITY_DN33711_c0_g1_i2:187-1173(-)
MYMLARKVCYLAERKKLTGSTPTGLLGSRAQDPTSPRGAKRGFSEAAVQTQPPSENSPYRSEASTQTSLGLKGVHLLDVKGELRLGTPVVLNVYDVKVVAQQGPWVNGILRNAGSGVFHAGIEVYGREWTYGALNYRGTGVHDSAPKDASHKYRESVTMGLTLKTQEEVMAILKELSDTWQGEDYDMLARNCCHFCDTLAKALDVDPLPPWVIRLADAGATLRDGVGSAVSVLSKVRSYGDLNLGAIAIAGSEEHGGKDIGKDVTLTFAQKLGLLPLGPSDIKLGSPLRSPEDTPRPGHGAFWLANSPMQPQKPDADMERLAEDLESM